MLPLIYAELRGLAGHYLRGERPDHTLSPTSLVHEAFLRLVDQKSVSWQSRSHFFGIAAQAMRRVLVDHARRRSAAKRSRHLQISLASELDPATPSESEEVVALDDALSRFAEHDPRAAKLVELRYFGGLTIDEAAAALDISPATAKRDWNLARAWLHRELSR